VPPVWPSPRPDSCGTATPQVLTAAYRVSAAATLDRLLAEGVTSPRDALRRLTTRLVEADTLRHLDPGLATFAPCNDRPSYEAALARAGLTIDADTADVLSS